jgi:hypothetical protein
MTNLVSISSNNVYKNPQIIEAQIKQVLKLRTNQYMGNAYKYLFWKELYSNLASPICDTNKINMDSYSLKMPTTSPTSFSYKKT